MTPDATFHHLDENFPFAESPQLGVYTSRAIFDGAEPILQVVHGEDGDWQFLPGRFVDEEVPVVLHLHHIVDLYPEVHELADLPPGWSAARDSPSDPWRRFRL
jgi:hypothetical protein